MPATAWDLFYSGWFSATSHWLMANSSFSHHSCSLSGWQCLVVLLCSARSIFSVCLSQASVFLWPATSPAWRYRGPNSEPDQARTGDLHIDPFRVISVRTGKRNLRPWKSSGRSQCAPESVGIAAGNSKNEPWDEAVAPARRSPKSCCSLEHRCLGQPKAFRQVRMFPAQVPEILSRLPLWNPDVHQ